MDWCILKWRNVYVSVCLHVIIVISSNSSSNSSKNNGRLRNDNEISLWHVSIDKTRTVTESSNFNVQHAFSLPCAYYVWIGMNRVLIVIQRDKMCLVFTVVPSTLKYENVRLRNDCLVQINIRQSIENTSIFNAFNGEVQEHMFSIIGKSFTQLLCTCVTKLI